MTLVAGVDSSTQSCKVLIRDVESGKILRTGSATHPAGTEVHPDAWLIALKQAIAEAGGIEDVSAISIAAQQHGMVALNSKGEVVRPALLWNDTRSADAADQLLTELGAERFITATGSVPVASFTITKLRWLRDNEPEGWEATHAVALPHDWLTWRLRGFGPVGESEFGPNFDELFTDRSDASGTGYFNSVTNDYDFELLEAALSKRVLLPRIVEAGVSGGTDSVGRIYASGAGDNAAAALGLGLGSGAVAVSIGTSGTVFASADSPTHDPTGTIAGFADAAGKFLPIGVTLNAARIIKSAVDLLEVDYDQLSELALSAEPGSEGLVLIPFFEGERTPNLPHATGSLHGMTLQSATRANFARAYIEGMICGLAYGLEALRGKVGSISKVLLIGGGAQSSAVQQIAGEVFGLPVEVPVISEYVAEGATVQAAWALVGNKPDWAPATQAVVEVAHQKLIQEQYQKVYLSLF